MIITARAGVKGAMALLPGLVLHHASGALTSEARRVMKGEALFLRHPATKHLQP
jgi:tRNA1(Val) A37 N6-methylase TrmN6